MSAEMGENKLTRLCHVIKRADFDGYGFNLHAEKGKAGQYIGKVDDHSPAETAGLRQGDRIIEVNGVNIGNETHKEVVQRIKAIANEVRLLVVDPSIVSVSNNNQVIDANTTVNNVHTKNSVPPMTNSAAPAATVTTGAGVAAATAATTNNNDHHDGTDKKPNDTVDNGMTNGNRNGSAPALSQSIDAHSPANNGSMTTTTTTTGNHIN